MDNLVVIPKFHVEGVDSIAYASLADLAADSYWKFLRPPPDDVVFLKGNPPGMDDMVREKYRRVLDLAREHNVLLVGADTRCVRPTPIDWKAWPLRMFGRTDYRTMRQYFPTRTRCPDVPYLNSDVVFVPRGKYEDRLTDAEDLVGLCWDTEQVAFNLMFYGQRPVPEIDDRYNWPLRRGLSQDHPIGEAFILHAHATRGEAIRVLEEGVARAKQVHRHDQSVSLGTIAILTPTRARPNRALAMSRSALANANRPEDVVVHFYVDEDDATSRTGLTEAAPSKVSITVGPRVGNSAAWNSLWRSVPAADIYMLGADDIVFRTPGWDEAVRKALFHFGDGIGLVFGDDGLQGDKLSTHPFVGRRGCELLGYFVPPCGFPALYNDAWLFELYGLAGRRTYLPDVFIEHVHPIRYPEVHDTVYAEAEARQAKANELWELVMGEIRNDAERLLSVLERG